VPRRPAAGHVGFIGCDDYVPSRRTQLLAVHSYYLYSQFEGNKETYRHEETENIMESPQELPTAVTATNVPQPQPKKLMRVWPACVLVGVFWLVYFLPLHSM
jgi:hypothetical protein